MTAKGEIESEVYIPAPHTEHKLGLLKGLRAIISVNV